MTAISRRAILVGTTAAAATWTLPDVADAAPKKVKPLSKAHRKALEAIPIDPPPDKLVQDQHFLVSDEHHPERFQKTLQDLGGIFLGVGPEQNYFYAGWAQPDVLILLDFDQAVVDLHAVYRAFFLDAKNADGLIKLFWSRNKKRAQAVMKAAAKDDAELKRMQYAYKLGHKLIRARLKQMKTRYAAMKLKTFLTDQDQYDYIVAMLKAGRVRAVRGDLTKDKAMNGVAKAAKKIGLKVRCMYLSNVEQYFEYETDFRNNLTVQPVDDKSLILRTVFKGKSKFDRYHYILQKDEHFRAWVKKPEIKKLHDIMKASKKRMKKKGEAWILPGPK